MNTLQQMIAHGATHLDTEDLDYNPWMKRDINGWHYWDDEYDAWDHCFDVTEDNMLPLPDDQPAPYWADAPENEPANNAPTWDDAPAWADCYGKVGIGSKTIWYNNEVYSYADGAKNGVYWFDNACNHNLAHVTPIERRPTNAPTWDGQGLPPVGVECEVCTNDGRIPWQKVTILAHDEHRAIFRDPLNKSIPTVYDWGSDACFRPIQADPRPGQLWRHKNDTTYEVLLITNQKSTDERYQPQVVYRGLEGPIWSRPLSDWHRSMTPKEDK